MNDETVACPSCGTRFRVRPEVAGRAVRCSRCGQVFMMPAAQGQKPAPTVAPDASKARGATPKATRAREGTPNAAQARGATPHASQGHAGAAGAPHVPAAGPDRSDPLGRGPEAPDGQVGTPDGIEAHGGALDGIDAIPQPGDAPAVGELGLSSAGGPTIHEPAARQGQVGKTSDSACAACGRTLAPSAVICVACGFDRRTRQRVDAELT